MSGYNMGRAVQAGVIAAQHSLAVMNTVNPNLTKVTTQQLFVSGHTLITLLVLSQDHISLDAIARAFD